MKLFLIIALLLTTQLSFSDTTNPRETFKTFLKSMVKIKNKSGNEAKNYELAISTLELKPEQKPIGKKYADQLIKVLDKIKKVNYEEIPESLNVPIWHFDKRVYNDEILEIYLVEINGQWLFGNSGLNSLDSYLDALVSKKLVSGVQELQSPASIVRNKLGKTWTKKSFFIENWQWLGLIVLIFLAFIIEKTIKFFISSALQQSKRFLKYNQNIKLDDAIISLSKVIFVFIIYKSIELLDLPTRTHDIFYKGLNIALTAIIIWFVQKLIYFISYIFEKRASETETKFDDILIPLITKTALVLTYIFGGVFVLNSLSFDVTNIIAGLGIGGLAFAFAAKDMLANFFGSIMLVLDRPFDIGDVIQAGDITGIVDEVGFRSTRIRTFNDSLITISNGEIMNRPIDNMGKRRFRRLVTNLGVEYDTPPEKIEAFCEGIRQLIISYPWTRKDNFHVYFSNFGPSSLDIKLVVYWVTDDYSRELSEKHRLLLDVLRLSKELEIGFAFPTQTIHMFNETKVETVKDLEDSRETFQKAQEKAKNVAKAQIALKNPRSNSEDKNQFGDNEFGV